MYRDGTEFQEMFFFLKKKELHKIKWFFSPQIPISAEEIKNAQHSPKVLVTSEKLFYLIKAH